MPKRIEVQLSLVDRLSQAVDKASKKVMTFGQKVKKVSKMLFNFRNVIIAGAVTAIGKAFIGAAAKIEIFAKQLEIVTGSAEKANKALAAIREFARTSPLETEDVVQSYVRLRAVGIDPTIKQMRTIGGVAVLMNREMTEVLDSFIGLNKRTLRRLGIDIDRTGAKAVIQSGDVRRVVEKDTASIREALLEVWEERFPNAIEEAANTTKAKIAIMKSEFFEMFVSVGELIKPFFDKIVSGITKTVQAIRVQLEVLKGKTTEEVRAIRFINEIIAKQKDEQKKINLIFAYRSKLLSELKEKQTDVLLLKAAGKSFEASQKRVNDLTAAVEVLRIKLVELVAGEDPLGGTGKMGTGVVDEEKDAAKKALEAFAKLVEKVRAREIKIQINATRAELDAINKKIDANEEYMEKLRKDAEEKEKLFQKEYEAKWRYHQLEIANRLEYNEKMEAAKESLYQHGSELLKRGIAESRASAKAKQRILIGIAVAEAAASAVTAAKAGWDTGVTFWDKAILAAAGIVEAAALAAGEIATIKSQSFARGTMHAPGGLSLVGEQGPELMNVPRGAQIFNNTQTRQMIGGNTISPVINIHGNASSETVGQIKNVLDDFGRKLEEGTRLGKIDWKRIGVATI